MNILNRFPIDKGIIISVGVLMVLGLTTLFSINPAFFISQLLYLGISLAAFFFFSQLNYKVVQNYMLVFYVGSLVFLLIVLFIGIESRGAIRWIDIFGIRIQFSEILKPFLLVSLCSFLARRDTSVRTLTTCSLLMLPIVLLIFLQPDLGNALIYVITSLFVFIIFGFSFLWFGLGLAIAGALTPFMWGHLHEYQRQRILTFLYPAKDPLGKSYNAIQSIIAVGSGRFFGKGFNESTQSGLRFLPERHTDFIFATLSEGLGFIGAFAVVGMFCFLLYRIFIMYISLDDPFCKLFAASTFFVLLVQFFINVGMNIGIVPVVGITLPFVSYGGSSLLSNFILLGLLASMASASKRKGVLEIR